MGIRQRTAAPMGAINRDVTFYLRQHASHPELWAL
jgi:hypothetical protein